MRICYLGTFDRDHVRNRVIIEGLRAHNVEVIEIHEPAWQDTSQRVSEAGKGFLQPKLWWRLIRAHASLAWRYLRAPRHDAVIVGYPGHTDLFLARLLCSLRRVPLIFDALLSIYETTVDDRHLLDKESFSARMLLRLEKLVCRLPDRILLDTDSHMAFFQSHLGVDAKRLRRVWVGAPESIMNTHHDARPDLFRVVYFGKFIPLHGLEYVLHAAERLRDHSEIQFELIGSGQTFTEMVALAESLHLENVTFSPEWLPLDVLTERVSGADACLGIFDTGAKAQRVIPVKAFLALALGLPLITADSPGIRELLVHEEHALLCPAGDPDALASAILRLYQDRSLAEKVAFQGQALYRACCTPHAIGHEVKAIIRELISQEPIAPSRHPVS